MTTTLVTLLFLVLLVGSFTALAPRGPWSEDSLAYTLHQLAIGNAHSIVEAVSTAGVMLFLAALAYFAARGVQLFVAEIGVKAFLVFMAVNVGALAVSIVISIVASPALSRAVLR